MAPPTPAATRACIVVASILLAGCAGGPISGPPNVAERPTEPLRQPDSFRVRSVEPTNSTVLLLAEPVRLDVAVPESAISVAYYLTVEEGASTGLRGDLEGCVREEKGPVTQGQTLGKDCGALPEGTRALTVGHAAGRASVRVVVNVTVRPCVSDPQPCAWPPTP